jgi:transcriptional regulator with XRE-family HTH domain
MQITKGVTNEAVQRATGISPYRYSRIRTATAQPTIDELHALARYFGVETWVLIASLWIHPSLHPRAPVSALHADGPFPINRCLYRPPAVWTQTFVPSGGKILCKSPLRDRVRPIIRSHRRTHIVLGPVPGEELFVHTTAINWDPTDRDRVSATAQRLERDGIWRLVCRSDEPVKRAARIRFEHEYAAGRHLRFALNPDRKKASYCHLHVADVQRAAHLGTIVREILLNTVDEDLSELRVSRLDICCNYWLRPDAIGIDVPSARKRSTRLYTERKAGGLLVAAVYTRIGGNARPKVVAYSKSSSIVRIECRLYCLRPGDLGRLDDPFHDLEIYDFDYRKFPQPHLREAILAVRNDPRLLRASSPGFADLLRVDHDPNHPSRLFERYWESALSALARRLGLPLAALGARPVDDDLDLDFSKP